MATAKKPTKKAPAKRKAAPKRKAAVKRKPNAPRSATRRAKDLEITARLYLKGMYQADIAKAVGVSVPTIARDLDAIRKIWLDSAVLDFDLAKAKELARIDVVEAEAWEAWTESKGAFSIDTFEDIGVGKFPGKNKKKQIREQTGDARFLQIVLTCSERRAKLLGINAPEKVAPTNPAGDKPYEPSNSANEEELDARIAELMDKLGIDGSG